MSWVGRGKGGRFSPDREHGVWEEGGVHTGAGEHGLRAASGTGCWGGCACGCFEGVEEVGPELTGWLLMITVCSSSLLVPLAPSHSTD